VQTHVDFPVADAVLFRDFGDRVTVPVPQNKEHLIFMANRAQIRLDDLRQVVGFRVFRDVLRGGDTVFKLVQEQIRVSPAAFLRP
jgi:hypothetical protein